MAKNPITDQQAATTATAEPQTGQQEEVTAPKTLPELLGELATKLLAALQSDNAAAKQTVIRDSLREMRIWYDAQPVEGRKEAARVCRKTLEQFKLVSEQFYQEMMAISATDVQ